MTVRTEAGSRTEWTLLFPIVGSHIKRIGLARVLAGGLSMYLSIPIFVLLHTTLAVALYQGLLRPLFGTPRVLWRNHVILDRHRIQGLSTIDKVNCLFCGYANGLATMMNTELDHLSRLASPLPFWKKALAALFTSLIASPVLLIGEVLGIQLIYNILVSRPLGLHRVSIAEARRVLEEHGYGERLRPLPRALLRAAKNTFLRTSMALEQIESSWCPLKHFEQREGIVYPDHHRKFFGPGEIEEMRRFLSTTGTVSDRKPTW